MLCATRRRNAPLGNPLSARLLNSTSSFSPIQAHIFLISRYSLPCNRFWQLAIKTASESSQRRFIQTFDSYCQSVVQQAGDRDSCRIRDVDSYFENRRENIGAKPSFALLELDMNLPDEVMTHPTIEKLTELAIDMLILGNVSL